ncbi:hypothetical protein [Streptomyces sp. NPDC002573]|uniref:hypothetical protein n=1 Tax=Streptomyces sp. NPDC002573 TaxID=3364651 RepID=UPI0036AD5746
MDAVGADEEVGFDAAAVGEGDAYVVRPLVDAGRTDAEAQGNGKGQPFPQSEFKVGTHAAQPTHAYRRSPPRRSRNARRWRHRMDAWADKTSRAEPS